jgi:hypothetical protein
MSRYLDQSLLVARLRAGRPLEQWLGTRPLDSGVAIRWLHLGRELSDDYSLTLFEVYDDGDENFQDVHEFSPVDVDEPNGTTMMFATPEELLSAARERFGANADNFVNRGMVQDEYADYLRTRKPRR